MSLCCECCVLSGRGLCDGLIPCTVVYIGYMSVVSILFSQEEVISSG